MSESLSVVSDSLWPYRLYSPCNSPGQNTGVGSHSLLQGNLPYPGIEPGSPTLQAGSLPSEPTRNPKCGHNIFFFLGNASKAVIHGFGQYRSWEWWKVLEICIIFLIFVPGTGLHVVVNGCILHKDSAHCLHILTWGCTWTVGRKSPLLICC